MPSNIPAGRVPMIDPRSGLVNRDWYAFFRELFRLVDAAQNAVTLTELQQLPPPVPATSDSSGIPTGMIAFFIVSTPPDGWEEVVELRGRYPRGMPLGGTPGTTGGTEDHTHTMSGPTSSVNINNGTGGVVNIPHSGHTHVNPSSAHIDPYLNGMWCRKL